MNRSQKSFYELFYKRELNPLLGKRKINLFVLVLMLFIAFTAIGFAKGSLDYLEYKMKDPFINWVNVLPGGKSSFEIQMIIDELNSEKIKQEYQLRSALGYNRFQLNFYPYDEVVSSYLTGVLDTNNIYGFPGRTLHLEDPVIQEVFRPNNYITGNKFNNQLDIGLAVTEEMLQNLNYPSNTKYIWIDVPALDPKQGMKQMRVAVPIPVRAVVRVLPGLTSFASSPYFFQQRMRVGDNPFNPLQDTRMLLSFYGTQHEVNSFMEKLTEYLQTADDMQGYNLSYVWTESNLYANAEESFLVYLRFLSRNISKPEMDHIFLSLYNARQLANYQEQVFRMYDYHGNLSSRVSQQWNYDRISLHFYNLDHLREFSVMLSNQHQIEVDMAQIESRENYYFVSQLTEIISFVLIAFSIISVLLFTSHLLKKHLDSIKRNLGTFKAFGLLNSLLINIYVRLVLSIFGFATILALIISAIFGYSGGMRLVLGLFGEQIEHGLYFSLLSVYLIFTVLLLIVFAIVVVRVITIKILNRTPGDLIYEREQVRSYHIHNLLKPLKTTCHEG